jgi:MFS family permease
VAAASAEGGETVTESAIERQTIRRISLRLLPMLFLLYLFAYIDRTNVGIAALQMNGELTFNSATFGFGAGIFFIGYALFEVPSNLILVRAGARRWLARIAISWGLLACAMMLVHNATQFYASRFLLGVAEAGLFPGVVYYLRLVSGHLQGAFDLLLLPGDPTGTGREWPLGRCLARTGRRVAPLWVAVVVPH